MGGNCWLTPSTGTCLLDLSGIPQKSWDSFHTRTKPLGFSGIHIYITSACGRQRQEEQHSEPGLQCGDWFKTKQNKTNTNKKNQAKTHLKLHKPRGFLSQLLFHMLPFIREPLHHLLFLIPFPVYLSKTYYFPFLFLCQSPKSEGWLWGL